MYAATRYADDNVLLVGDAASFIDPLSSAGVKKALASGWLAAVAVHTALLRPGMRDIALKFFAMRESEIYDAFRDLTRQFLAEAAAGHEHRFWNDRAEAEPTREGESEAALKTVFDAIRGAQSLRFNRGAGVQIDKRPAVSGSEIVLEERVVTDQDADGIRYVSDVDVVALLALAPDQTDVGELFGVYNSRFAPVALPDFLRALTLSVARGWLRLDS
jgi:hypothetical protein